MNFPTKCLLDLSMIKFKFLFLFTAILLLATSFMAKAGDIPPRPDPPRLVNDFTNLFSESEKHQLEQKLVAFDDSTTCQIVVVTIPDLKGDDPYDFAARLGKTWGVGQKGKSNGIVILIKPKTTDSKGQVFIAPGYGMEGIVPDAVADMITQKEIIPRFSEGKMFEGVDAAINILISLNKGEFKADQYMKSKHKKKSNSKGILIALVILIIIIIISKKSNNSQHMSGSGGGLPFWLLMGGLMGGGGDRSGGSFGDFKSGDNDFGGFGGGDFGGGGAGGSW